ncbi:hypothetical protein HK405_007529 [Cladochytrium tenue]|nr:hypothetical protein HK405_007529 [Cladochytrium tenue]
MWYLALPRVLVPVSALAAAAVTAAPLGTHGTDRLHRRDTGAGTIGTIFGVILVLILFSIYVCLRLSRYRQCGNIFSRDPVAPTATVLAPVPNSQANKPTTSADVTYAQYPPQGTQLQHATPPYSSSPPELGSDVQRVYVITFAPVGDAPRQ